MSAGRARRSGGPAAHAGSSARPRAPGGANLPSRRPGPEGTPVRSDAPAGGERSLLEAHGVRPRKRFGQNFLVDARVPALMVARAALPSGTPVLEIGPGSGALTAALLAAGHPVEAIELDRDLVPLLERRFAEAAAEGRFHLRAGDALALPWDLGPRPSPTPRPWIAGNLPYAITTPLLLRSFAHRAAFDGAIFMVQREYGERLLAAPGSKAYGSITVWTQAHAVVRALLKVGRSCFWPRPGVESIVLEFRFAPSESLGVDHARLERVLRAAFSQRRKTLANALAAGLGREKAVVEEFLGRAGIAPDVRAETLALDAFVRITATLPEPDSSASG